MPPSRPPSPERDGARTEWVLGGLTLALAGLAALLAGNSWGRVPAPRSIPLVAATFLDTSPIRAGYADLVAAKEDLSDYDCYACHDKAKPPPIVFDANHRIVIPKEHQNIAMGHGTHDRNNLCYNCHRETNLLSLQVRDGRELTYSHSTPLCGSCHGPTYRDWEAGVHGRVSGHWATDKGPAKRLDCVNCHDPHTPRIPPRAPAPGPHLLHDPVQVAGPAPAGPRQLPLSPP